MTDEKNNHQIMLEALKVYTELSQKTHEIMNGPLDEPIDYETLRKFLEVNSNCVFFLSFMSFFMAYDPESLALILSTVRMQAPIALKYRLKNNPTFISKLKDDLKGH